MGLPLPFLAGLVVLLSYEELGGGLPGSESMTRLIASLVLMFVPWVVARVTATRLRRVALDGAVPRFGFRMVLQLQPALVPICYAGIIYWGGLPEFAWRLSPELQLPRFLLLVGPLLCMEVAMRSAERPTVQCLELFRLPAPPQLGTDRLPMTFLVLVPIAALAGVADLLSVNRSLELFFLETSAGTAIGFLLFVGALCVFLPLAYRWLMPVSQHLPSHLADDLRRTAERLGFSGRSVLSMRTRHRTISALMVGLVPWPRFLVLTDGLLSLLDPFSLRGVVAHEVGHAKANHPAILLLVFVCLPVFLFYPAVVIGVLDWPEPDLLIALAVAVLIGIVGFRALAHRFEYEADQLSAEALGGASFCVQALRGVGQLAPLSRRKASFRHPSDASRIVHLFTCERNEKQRLRFWRRGRRVRAVVFTVVAAALACCIWALTELWPVDRVGYLFYSARFSEAQAQLDEIPADLPGTQGEYVDELRRVVGAGLALGLPEGDWEAVRDQLSAQARERAVAAASARDFDGAMPWLYLALEQREPPAWLRSLYLYSRAVVEQDDAEEARVREHLLTLDLPDGLAAALSSG